jgi:hypothetical protein
MNKNKGKRAGKRSTRNESENDAQGGKLVPFRMEPLTDAFRLPSKVGVIYSTLKSSNIEGWLTQSSTLFQSVAPTFTVANQCTDFTALSGVFDQYRIVAIECTAIPRINSATGGSTTAMSGQLYTVLDFDDNSILGSVAAALAYENCIASPAYQVQRRCFKPRVALAAYGGVSFSAYANAAAQWIDCSSSTVVHYGLKACCDAGTTGALQIWDLQIRSHVEFRATR